jgi:hypothetical protein
MGISTLEQIEKVFSQKNVKRIFVKHLAPKQDNDKNQIYLGKDLDGAANLFPSEVLTRSASKSTAKPKSSAGSPKLEAKLNFEWVNGDGNSYPAPNTRIIDYFQFPEIRLSGFISNCSNPPDALRRNNLHKYGKRILLLGVNNIGITYGLVLTEVEDPVVETFPQLPSLPALPILSVLVIGYEYTVSPRELLLHELTQIHKGGWHPSSILKRGEHSPQPFKGTQGGGYTLEALLGVSANADKKPDKHGYEIKSFSRDKISLMTPTADEGYEGQHTFREYMKKYGRPGRKGDGRVVFTGVHNTLKINSKTGFKLCVEGYDESSDSFSDNTGEIAVTMIDPNSGDRISVWTINRLLDSWNKKHSSACYIKCKKREHSSSAHDYEYKYENYAYFCEGTSIWRLLRAIHSGKVYYDPAHTIYADNSTSVRPQWRISTSKLELKLGLLYRDVSVVNLCN